MFEFATQPFDVGNQTGRGYRRVRRVAGATVHDDAAIDQLFGEAGQDWFFYHASGSQADVLGDKAANEIATLI